MLGTNYQTPQDKLKTDKGTTQVDVTPCVVVLRLPPHTHTECTYHSTPVRVLVVMLCRVCLCAVRVPVSLRARACRSSLARLAGNAAALSADHERVPSLFSRPSGLLSGFARSLWVAGQTRSTFRKNGPGASGTSRVEERTASRLSIAQGARRDARLSPAHKTEAGFGKDPVQAMLEFFNRASAKRCFVCTGIETLEEVQYHGHGIANDKVSFVHVVMIAPEPLQRRQWYIRRV